MVDDFIEKWLDYFNQKNDYKKQKSEEYIQLFFKFIKKTPEQIINEKK